MTDLFFLVSDRDSVMEGMTENDIQENQKGDEKNITTKRKGNYKQQRGGKGLPKNYLNSLKGTKKPKLSKTNSGSLSWFVQRGLIKPAPRHEPSSRDPLGYQYLKEIDLKNCPYTVLVGVYKGDERFFVVGRQSADRYVLIYLPAIEIFTSPTSAPSCFIKAYQDRDPKGVKNDSRMSGFDYLRFVQIKMPGAHEIEEYITLTNVKNRIQAEIQTAAPIVRNVEDLWGNHYPQEIDNDNPFFDKENEILQEQEEIKQIDYPYETHPSMELSIQCSSYLELPKNFKIDRDAWNENKDIILNDKDIRGGLIYMR